MTTSTIPEHYRFGDAGDRYPIQPGDVWQLGPHLVACGDLERQSADELLTIVADHPRLFYCDPPWYKGQAQLYRTWAGLRENADYLGTFIPAILRVAGLTRGETWLEMNKVNLALIEGELKQRGYRIEAIWPILGGPHKAKTNLIRAWREMSHSTRNVPDLSGRSDMETPAIAVEHVTDPGDLVTDMCTGFGLTLQACERLGRRFVGLELHPRRLAVAVDRTVALNPDLKPEKVAVLRTMVRGA